MARHSEGRTARLSIALVSALALTLEGTPLFAQRRQAEPEANPDFQNSMRGKSDGEPVSGGEAAAAEPAAPAEPAPDDGGDDKIVESRAPVRSVQIGAVPSSKAAPAVATNPLDTRVTVRVKGAPLATFLDTISAQAKVNFIITEGLEQKRVTAFLQNVTVREALQVLLEIRGLTYQQIGHSNTYVVTQRSKQAENRITRIYTLSFIPLIPLSADDFGEVTGAAAGGAPAGGSAAGGAAGGGSNASKPCAMKNQRISVTRIICTVLSKAGDIELDSRTNSLIVTDIPEVFPQVEQILAELDRKAPQVMIEAQIVEIDSDRTRNLGFEWGGANGELGTFTGGQRDTSFPLNLPNNLSHTHLFDPLNPTGGIISSIGGASGATNLQTGITTSGLTPSNGGYLKTSVLDLSQLQITLRALIERTEGRFLGKPKIMTLNNKTATIEISAKEAVSVQTNQSSAGGSTGLQSTSAERYPTGVVLKVTPQVNKEGYITMLLEPSYTDVQVAAISTPSNPVYNPITREAKTLVRVKNGQTLVLGGLLRSIETKDVRKVPFLGYIPLIGWLFTSDLNSRQNTDLVIFITPTIVSD